ncbi:MAG: glycosyltransferase [Bacteroidota bacterium]|nr:MAG: glycosyltransferase [Bacteroidota bacterium]
MRKKKILILVPSPRSPGGVGHYYQTIKPYYTINIRYFVRGVRNQQSLLSRMLYPLVQLFDYLCFVFQLLFYRYQLIHVNTSFGFTGILRDAGFILLAKHFRKKYLVFFRGIDEAVMLKVEKKLWKLFRNTFLKADMIWVLSHKLEAQLREWGYQGPVEVETTLVDEALLNGFDFESSLAKYNSNHQFEILFMSRLEKTKGIYEAIEAFRILQQTHPWVRMRICGSGSERSKVEQFIGEQLNREIFLEGHVSGTGKIKAFTQAHLFLFPSYFEGMPNAVLEALAFGLPVVTSKVGGIPDIFIDHKMGYLTTDISAPNLARLMAMLIDKPEHCKAISQFNYEYARGRFYAGEVCRRVEQHYKKLLDDSNSHR